MIFKKYSLVLKILLLASSMVMNLTAAKKKHRCTYEGCGRRFVNPSYLLVHNRSHTGERPYGCDHPSCDMKFASESILKLHYRTHTGERPYACDHPDCDMSFSQQCALTRHYRTHTGERPYACDHLGCEMSFSEKSTLTKHYRTHTGKTPYACNYPDCYKRFISPDRFKSHLMAHAAKKTKVKRNKKKSITKSAEINPDVHAADSLDFNGHQALEKYVGLVPDKDLMSSGVWIDSDDEIGTPPVVTKKAKVEKALPPLLPPLITKTPNIDE